MKAIVSVPAIVPAVREALAPVDAVVPSYVFEPVRVTVIGRAANVTGKSAVVADTL